jgi:hypothetical protein
VAFRKGKATPGESPQTHSITENALTAKLVSFPTPWPRGVFTVTEYWQGLRSVAFLPPGFDGKATRTTALLPTPTVKMLQRQGAFFVGRCQPNESFLDIKHLYIEAL